MRTLIVTVGTGGGHTKVANTIKSILHKKNKKNETLILDMYRDTNKIINKIIVGTYLCILKYKPNIYKKIYDNTEYCSSKVNNIIANINILLTFGIKKIINKFNPDIIICTHPLSTQVVSKLKLNNKIKNIPIISILTDYKPHSFWIQDNVNAYIVANEKVKDYFSEWNYKKDNIYPIGIPIEENFFIEKDRTSICKNLNVKNIKTVLIMGGSLGIGDIYETLKSIRVFNIQTIVITGKNKKLKKQIDEMNGNKLIENEKDVISIGYTDKISDYMTISDYIITKPGGITITEALVKNLKIFINKPIPGQEERNEKFLLENNLATKLYDVAIRKIFNKEMKNPVKTEQIFPQDNCSEALYNILSNYLQ